MKKETGASILLNNHPFMKNMNGNLRHGPKQEIIGIMIIVNFAATRYLQFPGMKYRMEDGLMMMNTTGFVTIALMILKIFINGK